MQNNIYEHLFGLESSEEVEKLVTDRSTAPLIYHPNYNLHFFGVEHFHPFDGAKYEKIINYLTKEGFISPNEEKKLLRSKNATVRNIFHPSAKPTNEQLCLIHSEEYLKSLESSSTIASICEFPPLYIFPSGLVYNRIVSPMLYQVSGTILAGRVAIDRGVAINVGGGMHHASATSGGGWCVFSDIYLSLNYLRKHFPQRIKRALIIDLDIHQGNGIETDKINLNDKDTFMMDMYNPEIYPGDTFAYKGINRSVRITPEQSAEYNTLMRQGLQTSLTEFPSPDIAFYNAGTDVLVGDPLNGGMTVTPEQVIERDEIVFEELRSKNIPVVMVLSGGYTKPLSSQTISKSLENLFLKGYIQ